MIRALAVTWLLLCGFALPDRALTPGETVSVSRGHLCALGYSKAVRHVTPAMKRQACALYGAAACPGPRWELDHLISLELGGANSIANLWPQPIAEARKKDVLENFLHRAVCTGAIDLKDAQHDIATNWPAAYRRMQGR